MKKTTINDENKENCVDIRRFVKSGGLGVNGSSSTKGKSSRVSLRKEDGKKGRTPLKELPLNGFVEKLKKRDVAESVEVVVCHPKVPSELIVEYAGVEFGGRKWRE